MAVNNLAGRVKAAPGGTLTLTGPQLGQALGRPPQEPWADALIRRALKYNGVTVTKQKGWLSERYTFTAHAGGLAQLGIAQDDYQEIAAQALMQCVIGIGLAGRASGVGLGRPFQMHVMELFRRFSAPDGTLTPGGTSDPERQATRESFELWRETYGEAFGMQATTYEQFVAGAAQTELQHDLTVPPEYLRLLAQVNPEFAMMVIQGVAELISAFVVTTPFRAPRVAALDAYKERWFAVSAEALGVRYVNGQFVE